MTGHQDLIDRLTCIHSALSEALGDTDPNPIDDETDEELRERDPLFWAAKELALLMREAEFIRNYPGDPEALQDALEHPNAPDGPSPSPAIGEVENLCGLTSMGEKMEWRDIKTAPKDGSHFLAWCRLDADEYDEDNVKIGRVIEHYQVVAYWCLFGFAEFPFRQGSPQNVKFLQWRPLPSDPPRGSLRGQTP